LFILIVFNHHLFLNEDYQDLSKKFLHFAAFLHFLFIIANAPSKNADRAGKSNERRRRQDWEYVCTQKKWEGRKAKGSLTGH